MKYLTVVVTILIEEASTPAGRVALNDDVDKPFEGWLQLLKILSDAIANPTTGRTP